MTNKEELEDWRKKALQELEEKYKIKSEEIQKKEEITKPIIPYVQKVEQALEQPKQEFSIELVDLMKSQQEMHKKNLMLELSNLIISIFIFIFLIIIVVLGTSGVA